MKTITHYNIDRSQYTADGAINKLLDYESDLANNETFDTLEIGNSVFAEVLADVVDEHTERVVIFEKRWGLRPYRFNVFTTYDFNEGPLKGWSIGGGFRYASPDIMGEENGVELEGEPQTNTDLLLRYRTSRVNSFLGDGRWTFQLNVNNVFDDRSILSQRFATDGFVYSVPSRGTAFTRFDVPTPREYRFSMTYDF